MVDVDIDPFGEHIIIESRTDETGENIPLTPVGPRGIWGRSTWEPMREQETSFRGRESQRNRVLGSNFGLKVYMRDCLKNGQEPQKYFTTTCLNLEMGNCTSETRGSP